ncbi:hypothetical protein [Streptomyces sp. NPDC014676]
MSPVDGFTVLREVFQHTTIELSAVAEQILICQPRDTTPTSVGGDGERCA